eukprot:4990520-Pleurochrysis_carterae.AAC.1
MCVTERIPGGQAWVGQRKCVLRVTRRWCAWVTVAPCVHARTARHALVALATCCGCSSVRAGTAFFAAVGTKPHV